MSTLYGHPTAPEFDNNGSVTSVVDWLGNRVGIGDPVIYCVGAGRGQMMAIGVVVDMEFEPGFIGTRYSSRDQLSIRVLTEATSGNWDNKARSAPAWVNAMNVTLRAGVNKA